MAQERLTMKKIREVLRLKYEAGLSNREIARACRISYSTVGNYLKRAEAGGMRWPLAEDGEGELTNQLFPKIAAQRPASRYPMPDLGKDTLRTASKGGNLAVAVAGIQSGIPNGIPILAVL